MHNCLTCSTPIPNWIEVDGKQRNLSRRYRCISCSPFKSGTRIDAFRDSRKGDQVTCSGCSRVYIYDYRKGHTTTQCNSCTVNCRREAVKKWAIAYKGGCCQKCGYSKSARALCFHHTDPSKKELEINASSAARSKKVLQAELDKCLLLCCNCHMEAHDEIEQAVRVRRMTNSPKDYAPVA